MNYLVVVYILLTFCTAYAMEKEERRPSRFLLTMDTQNVSPNEFNSDDLRRSASNIKNAQKYLKFLENEFRLEHDHCEHRITQFDQLTEYLALYLKYTTLENQEGDCIDSNRIWELKIHVQDRGSLAYFARGNYFKRKAIKLFEEADQIHNEEQKNKKYQYALKAARCASNDFECSYKIENCNKLAQDHHKKMNSYCNEIEDALHELPTYQLGLQQAKMVVRNERALRKKLRSACQNNFEKNTEESEKYEEEEKQKSLRKRSNTLGSIRKIFPRKKKDVEKEVREIKKKKRHSCPVPELTLPSPEEQIAYLNELNQTESNLFTVIDSYLTIFEGCPDRALLTKAQKLLDNAREIEDKKASISPHLFTVWPEIGQLSSRIQAGLELLEKQEDASGSSISDRTYSSDFK